jgi:acylphosphatase
MIVARTFLIGGRVQAVGFRMFAQEAAMIEGVHGFVRNLPDGRVEAFDVEPATPTHRATGFAIR